MWVITFQPSLNICILECQKKRKSRKTAHIPYCGTEFEAESNNSTLRMANPSLALTMLSILNTENVHNEIKSCYSE